MAKSRHLFRAFAAAIALPALLAGAAAIPAQAQISLSIGIGFDNFHNRLAPYGSWSNHPRWGQVWHPRAARDFRPYYYGHWVNTREYGWMWVSDESWGDITYHYGRWVYDPDEGWLWVPGYVWGPSWVVWRSGGGNIGWFPMPPGDDYYGDGAYRGNFDDEYGYRDWYGPSFGNVQFLALWTFVGESHFGDRNFRNYAVPQRDYGRFIGQTRDFDQLHHRQQLRRQSQRRCEPSAAGHQAAFHAGARAQRDPRRRAGDAGDDGTPDRTARAPAASDSRRPGCSRTWRGSAGPAGAARHGSDSRRAQRQSGPTRPPRARQPPQPGGSGYRPAGAASRAQGARDRHAEHHASAACRAIGSGDTTDACESATGQRRAWHSADRAGRAASATRRAGGSGDTTGACKSATRQKRAWHSADRAGRAASTTRRAGGSGDTTDACESATG